MLLSSLDSGSSFLTLCWLLIVSLVFVGIENSFSLIDIIQWLAKFFFYCLTSLLYNFLFKLMLSPSQNRKEYNNNFSYKKFQQKPVNILMLQKAICCYPNWIQSHIIFCSFWCSNTWLLIVSLVFVSWFFNHW